MKELSIEEKAKAYDKALERVKNIKTGKCETTFIFTEGLFEYIFPELKENDGEMIRKWCISHFKGCIRVTKDNAEYQEYLNNKVIPWLEKQGEQKTADKVEPKFREGDTIIHKELGGDYIHNPHKIIQVDILDKKYRLEGGLVAHFGEQDDYELVEQKPAWSEEDNVFFKAIIRDIENVQYISEDAKKDRINWLESLKDRVQRKQEWSEEDESKIKGIINTLEGLYDAAASDTTKNLYRAKTDWLKSLKERMKKE